MPSHAACTYGKRANTTTSLTFPTVRTGTIHWKNKPIAVSNQLSDCVGAPVCSNSALQLFSRTKLSYDGGNIPSLSIHFIIQPSHLVVRNHSAQARNRTL